MFSIIIPAYNAGKTLSACLDSLKNQTVNSDQFEIIVVDDGSSDNTADIARQFDVQILQKENGGPASARNVGAEVATGDLLLFTDADCIPASDWLAQISEPFQDPTVMGVKGVYRTDQPEFTARFVQLEYEDKYDGMLGTYSIDFVDTYSAAYRRDVFRQMGGFDISLRTNEDVEFAFRMASAGHRLVFAPQAIVTHIHDRNLYEYAYRKFFVGYWRSFVMRDHPSKLISDSHTPQVSKIQIIMAALGGILLTLSAVFRKKELAGLGLINWFALIGSGLPFYYKIWQRDLPVLLIAPFLIFIRAWTLGLGFLVGMWRMLDSDKNENQ
ncbi:MAG: hypothetical protein B6242_02340 [Anaerolineaceae bacterium 4572_78]|nr:MAG: hypothetical protein B6242_02340 [Anaerolineaceae bacterium 4572_78]